jgi:hypothetical protein
MNSKFIKGGWGCVRTASEFKLCRMPFGDTAECHPALQSGGGAVHRICNVIFAEVQKNVGFRGNMKAVYESSDSFTNLSFNFGSVFASLRRDEMAQQCDKMARNWFVVPEIKGNQGKSSPRAGDFLELVEENTERRAGGVRKFPWVSQTCRRWCPIVRKCASTQSGFR